MQFLLFLILCIMVPNAFSGMGKAFHFLQSRAFQGDPPGTGYLYEDPVSVDNSGAHKVLFGHYSAILEKGGLKVQPQAKSELTSRSLGNPEALQKLHLSKITDIYRRNLYARINAAVNLTKGSHSNAFQSQLESCKDELKKCDGLGDREIECKVQCLSKGNSLFSNLNILITSLVDRFCKSINTLFDKFFEVTGKPKHPNLRKYALFLKRVADAKKSLQEVGVQGAAALLPIIIDKVKTDMMPFRLFNDQLETALQVEQLLHPSVDTTSMTANYLCFNVDYEDIAEKLLDVLYRDKTLIDAIFGGLTSTNLISKYLPGRFQVPFAATSEAVRILTGSICGLVKYAETGKVPDCDQIGGFPVPGIPLPELPGMPSLQPECLQGSTNEAVNEEEKDDTEKGENTENPFRLPEDAIAPPAERRKRDVGIGLKNTAFIAREDGATDDKIGLRLNSNGVGGREKRSLIVGKRKLE